MPTETSPALLPAALGALVRERRSIRLFRPDPLPVPLLRTLLAEVCWAPSPHNSQPWRFTVLRTEEDRRALGAAMAQRLAAELRTGGLPESEIDRQTSRSQLRIQGAPVVILLSLVADGLVPSTDARLQTLEYTMAVQSVGAALQTLFLTAAARGIGSCWMAAPMYCPEVVRATLALPEDHDPQALALLGWPANPGKLRPRRPADDVIDIR